MPAPSRLHDYAANIAAAELHGGRHCDCIGFLGALGGFLGAFSGFLGSFTAGFLRDLTAGFLRGLAAGLLGYLAGAFLRGLAASLLRSLTAGFLCNLAAAFLRSLAAALFCSLLGRSHDTVSPKQEVVVLPFPRWKRRATQLSLNANANSEVPRATPCVQAMLVQHSEGEGSTTTLKGDADELL